MKNYILQTGLIALLAMAGCKKAEPARELPAEEMPVVQAVWGTSPAAYTDQTARFHFAGDPALAGNGSLYASDELNFWNREMPANTFASDIADGNGPQAPFDNPYSITLDANGDIYSTDENDPRTPADVWLSTPAFADVDAGTTCFDHGNSVIADATGNVYISDAANNRIRKISISGNVTTIAGNGVAGYRDGDARTAQFNSPGAIALDNDGNLYVADRGNLRIRRISKTGIVSTIAGNGTEGTADGWAANAQFSFELNDIVIDGSGNLFIEDANRIRMISPPGKVCTIAGGNGNYRDGYSTIAQFNVPTGMGVDSRGNVYIADLANNSIRKVSLE
jgi:serine/threonine protein kinase, bacterial